MHFKILVVLSTHLHVVYMFVQVPATLRAVVLLDPLTTDFNVISIKHTSSGGISKDVKGHKIKEGIGFMLDLKLAATEKIKIKVI